MNPLAFLSLVIVVIIILSLLALGFGEQLLSRTVIVRNFREVKHKWQDLEMDMKRKSIVKLALLGNLRIEEVVKDSCASSCSDIAQRQFWQIATVVWYKEKSLAHLYEELQKVATLFLVLLLLSCANEFLSNSDKFSDIVGYATFLSKSGYHLIPILEVFSLTLIVFRIFAELQSIKVLIKEHE